MSPADVASAARRRLDRLLLLADVLPRLGLPWLLFRLRHTFEQHAGIAERRSPRRGWSSVRGGHEPMRSVVATDDLSKWLAANVPDGRRDALERHVADVRHRRFDVFGSTVVVSDWHHDPMTGGEYPRDVHWSRVDELPGCDIKYVWEPSRFGWAFDLARAHHVVPESGAADVFWETFAGWCDANPPNTGVHWNCGQESSIRLIAVTAAAQAMTDTVTDEREAMVRRLAWVTAERVLADIAYARSQRNNHHASEAVGLLTAALIFPGHPDEADWLALGLAHLDEVCERLVMADGGTSQYSTNYHRVFVHDLVWAAMCLRAAGREPSAAHAAALRRSARFLEALSQPVTGAAPFIGSEDGGRVLPVSSQPHRVVGDDVDLALAAAGLDPEQPTACTGESRAWFGLPEPPAFEAAGPGPWGRRFPDFGLFVLGMDGWRCYVRCGSFRFRPGDDDLLHCDVWVDGRNVIADGGTHSYRPAVGEPGFLDEHQDHNGPRALDDPGVPKVSRFLRARWPAATGTMRTEPDRVLVACRPDPSPDGIERTVELSRDGVHIHDVADTTIRARFRLPAGEAPESAVELVPEADDVRRQDMTTSPHYGSWASVPGLELTGRRLSMTLRRVAVPPSE